MTTANAYKRPLVCINYCNTNVVARRQFPYKHPQDGCVSSPYDFHFMCSGLPLARACEARMTKRVASAELLVGTA
jgi:hypothetical protein